MQQTVNPVSSNTPHSPRLTPFACNLTHLPSLILSKE